MFEFGWWPGCYEAARSANTPADRSKRATQLSPGAALPALCLLVPGRIVIPYTECVVWCTAIKIMMITARKRGLILAVGGGFDVAARKRAFIMAVGGGFDVAAMKRGAVRESCRVQQRGDSVCEVVRKSDKRRKNESFYVCLQVEI